MMNADYRTGTVWETVHGGYWKTRRVVKVAGLSKGTVRALEQATYGESGQPYWSTAVEWFDVSPEYVADVIVGRAIRATTNAGTLEALHRVDSMLRTLGRQAAVRKDPHTTSHYPDNVT